MLGRRLILLVPASLAGFEAPGGSAGPVAVMKVLAVLFVVVFFVALALSVINDAAAARTGRESRSIGRRLTPRVSHAAAYQTQSSS